MTKQSVNVNTKMGNGSASYSSQRAGQVNATVKANMGGKNYYANMYQAKNASSKSAVEEIIMKFDKYFYYAIDKTNHKLGSPVPQCSMIIPCK